MGIRINENIFSLIVNRNLVRAGNNLEDSFRKLSSGSSITRAGDDPAGLATSHLLRGKIQGLQRNLMNSNEALNLLSVAESSLNNVTEILQRMRELAIQASNDTYDDSQRTLIQAEVDELLDEIQRISETANYNERALLDGTFKDLRVQVGTREGETMPIQIESAQTSVLGSAAVVEGLQWVSGSKIQGDGDLTINGSVIPMSEYDGISFSEGEASAIAKAKAINSMSYLTQVTATIGETVHQVDGAQVGSGTLDGVLNSLVINGTNIGPVDFVANDGDGVLREQINRYTSITGVTASLGSRGEMVLTAEDGRNIQVETTGGVASDLGLQVGGGNLNTVVRGKLTLSSSETIQLGGAGVDLIGFNAAQSTTFVDTDTAIENLKVTTRDNAQRALLMIDIASKQVLRSRASLGALESRVNMTIDDLMVNIENLSSADSRIRDADFAIETSKLTQAQIIQEAGIAILSQANVVPRMALGLLDS